MASTAASAIYMLLYIALVGAYIALGGLCLHALESAGETDEAEAVEKRLIELNITGALRDELENTLGVCSFPGTLHWDISGSMFFAMTVVTTIGYGTATPVTVGGRFFTTVYAVFGIGVVMSALTKIANTLMAVAQGVLEVSNKIAMDGTLTDDARKDAELTFDRFDKDGSGSIDSAELSGFLAAVNGDARIDPRVSQMVFERADADNSGCISRDELMGALAIFYQVQAQIPAAVPAVQLVAVALAVCVWMLLWALVYSSVEGWKLAEALWWSFVTLSTIGFGDYAPHTHLGRYLSFLFVVLGLGMLAWLFSAISQNIHAKKYWMVQEAKRKGRLPGRKASVSPRSGTISPASGAAAPAPPAAAGCRGEVDAPLLAPEAPPPTLWAAQPLHQHGPAPAAPAAEGDGAAQCAAAPAPPAAEAPPAPATPTQQPAPAPPAAPPEAESTPLSAPSRSAPSTLSAPLRRSSTGSACAARAAPPRRRGSCHPAAAPAPRCPLASPTAAPGAPPVAALPPPPPQAVGGPLFTAASRATPPASSAAPPPRHTPQSQPLQPPLNPASVAAARLAAVSEIAVASRVAMGSAQVQAFPSPFLAG